MACLVVDAEGASPAPTRATTPRFWWARAGPPRPVFPSSGTVLGLFPGRDYTSETPGARARGHAWSSTRTGSPRPRTPRASLFGEERLQACFAGGRGARRPPTRWTGCCAAVRAFAAGSAAVRRHHHPRPAAHERVAAPIPTQGGRSMSHAEPSVLIVDDERVNIDLMVDLLKPALPDARGHERRAGPAAGRRGAAPGHPAPGRDDAGDGRLRGLPPAQGRRRHAAHPRHLRHRHERRGRRDEGLRPGRGGLHHEARLARPSSRPA